MEDGFLHDLLLAGGVSAVKRHIFWVLGRWWRPLTFGSEAA